LSGTGLVLQDNGGDDLAVASSGNFTFATSVASGADYSVTVRTQPSNPAQTCVLSNASGTIVSGNVTNVSLTCTTNTYAVGGAVSGLSGTGLVLQANGGDDLAVSSSGNFTFATRVASGADYSVTVRTQPSNPSQSCVLGNASGTIGSGDVSNVSVACAPVYSVGGTVSGLSADSALVLLNGSEELVVSSNGSFVFATGVASGAVYNVTVRTQPTAPVQTCTVTNATGTMNSSGVADVVVSCDGIALLAGALGGSGSVDGMGGAARFNRPYDVATDAAGNVFVADSVNNTIRKITAAGEVSILAGTAGAFGSADGDGSAARFSGPRGIATDATGNVYVADYGNRTIRKITPTGIVSTLAGAAAESGSADGSGSAARFRFPNDIASDASGNLYVADTNNHTIRRITPAGMVSTLAGAAEMPGSADGSGSAARFNFPRGVAVDAAGNVYVADSVNHTIRKITPAGVVSTVAGTTGQSGSIDGSAALFNLPTRLAVDSAGNLLVADASNHTIRMITPAGVVSTLAGRAGARGSVDGSGSAARFSTPYGIAIDSAGNAYVADGSNHTIRRIAANAVVSTLAGTAIQPGAPDGSGTAARFRNPYGIATDSVGNAYVADSDSHTIRKITPAGMVSTLAGMQGQAGSADGSGTAARFTSPVGVATDSAGNIYVADFGNHTIRKITASGVVSTLAGAAGEGGSNDGIGSVARFDAPFGIAADSSGNVYVADQNHVIRKITPAAVVSTLAGTAGQVGFADGAGSAARFFFPTGLDVDPAGNVYVADSSNSTIRKITPEGVVTTLAGTAGTPGSADGSGSAALFNSPTDVAVDPAGNIYVTDSFNNTIRRITPDATVTTVAGTSASSGVLLGPLPGSLNGPLYIALLPGPRLTLVETDLEKGILMITLP